MISLKHMNAKQFERLLSANGYVFKRQSGSHRIYSNGKDTISVPKNNEQIIQYKLIKKYKLKEN